MALRSKAGGNATRCEAFGFLIGVGAWTGAGGCGVRLLPTMAQWRL